VEAGGRTGLTTLTTAGLMVAALFLTPLILAVPAAATAPALVIVGIFMLQSVTEIDMGDFSVVVPAMLTLMAIPLTSSVALGIGLGLIAAAVLALVTGKPRSFSPMGYAIAAVFSWSSSTSSRSTGEGRLETGDAEKKNAAGRAALWENGGSLLWRAAPHGKGSAYLYAAMKSCAWSQAMSSIGQGVVVGHARVRADQWVKT
jgi:hypothetical protein